MEECLFGWWKNHLLIVIRFLPTRSLFLSPCHWHKRLKRERGRKRVTQQHSSFHSWFKSSLESNGSILIATQKNWQLFIHQSRNTGQVKRWREEVDGEGRDDVNKEESNSVQFWNHVPILFTFFLLLLLSSSFWSESWKGRRWRDEWAIWSNLENQMWQEWRGKEAGTTDKDHFFHILFWCWMFKLFDPSLESNHGRCEPRSLFVFLEATSREAETFILQDVQVERGRRQSFVFLLLQEERITGVFFHEFQG